MLGIPKTTFYSWYDRYRAFGKANLKDRNSHPGQVWNRIPDDIRADIIDLALDKTDLVSPGIGRQVLLTTNSSRKPFATGCSSPTL